MIHLVQPHIIALAILIVIFFSVRRSKSRRYLINKIFNLLVFTNFLSLFLMQVMLFLMEKQMQLVLLYYPYLHSCTI